MPSKIKKKEIKKLGIESEDEKINKAFKIIGIIAVIGILIMICIATFYFVRDSSYEHSANPLVKFSYSEGTLVGGYDVYEVELKNGNIYTLHNLGDESVNIDGKWNETKYLNFNEDFYNSGALDFNVSNIPDEVENETNAWNYRLEVVFKNGETFVSYGVDEHPQNTEGFRKLIKKYFDGDITI